MAVERATSSALTVSFWSIQSASWAAWARKADSERPETRTAAGSWVGDGLLSAGASRVVAGACSRIRWALVPLIPKEETPARRGCPFSVHSRASASSSTEPALQSTWVVGASTLSVRGSVPARIAITILMIPATPAAAWVWPMFDFSEPSQSGFSRSWP
ncbi:hypothetical protein Kisp01_22400 [Kineosporia sp. NBRC 101677]|nr:hypothetical protein Kisp01_22400 [Kineosporia sp. NBRC 101677]